MIVNEGSGGGKKLPVLTNPAEASDLLLNKQLIDSKGNIMTGTMPVVDHPNPTIMVGANGLITASHGQATGKVAGGTTQATHQLSTQASTTITPGTSQKVAVASGQYTTGPVYVAGSSNLKASNIVKGVNIFGVTGTYQGMQIFETSGNYSTNSDDSSTSFSVSLPSNVSKVLYVELLSEDFMKSGKLPQSFMWWYCGFVSGIAPSLTPTTSLYLSGVIIRKNESYTADTGWGGDIILASLSGNTLTFRSQYVDGSFVYYPDKYDNPNGISYRVIYTTN